MYLCRLHEALGLACLLHLTHYSKGARRTVICLSSYETFLQPPTPTIHTRYPSTSRYASHVAVWQTSDATTPTPYPLTYPPLGRPPSYPPYPPSYPLPPSGQSLDSQGNINRSLYMVSSTVCYKACGHRVTHTGETRDALERGAGRRTG